MRHNHTQSSTQETSYAQQSSPSAAHRPSAAKYGRMQRCTFEDDLDEGLEDHRVPALGKLSARPHYEDVVTRRVVARRKRADRHLHRPCRARHVIAHPVWRGNARRRRHTGTTSNGFCTSRSFAAMRKSAEFACRQEFASRCSVFCSWGGSRCRSLRRRSSLRAGAIRLVSLR